MKTTRKAYTQLSLAKGDNSFLTAKYPLAAPTYGCPTRPIYEVVVNVEDGAVTNVSGKIDIDGIVSLSTRQMFVYAPRNRVMTSVCEYDNVLSKDGCGIADCKKAYSTAICAGDKSLATCSGYLSSAFSTRYLSVSRNKGYKGFAVCAGPNSIAVSTNRCSYAVSKGPNSIAYTVRELSASVSLGANSVAMSRGRSSAAICVGRGSVAQAEDYGSVAVSLGRCSKASGKLGCWLVLAEYGASNDDIINMKAVRVDGKTIKADTLYQLENGEIKEI